MKTLDPTTLAVLEVIAGHDDTDDGLRAGEIATLLRARGGFYRFENATSVAMRIIPLERRGLVVTVRRPKVAFATLRGRDVAEGGMQCRECGCTDNDACEDGCSWAESNLCTGCSPGLVLA